VCVRARCVNGGRNDLFKLFSHFQMVFFSVFCD
jgi:hypothetical protein